MGRFEVTVVQTIEREAVFHVIATNAEEAEKKALDEAREHDFDFENVFVAIDYDIADLVEEK
jgi:hypothetical protein